MKRVLLAIALFLFSAATGNSQIGGLLSGGTGPGRSVLNPTIDYASAYQFINLMKTCNTLRGSSTFNFPAYLNADNYPIANLPTSILCGATSPTFAEYSGAYVIAWSGSFGATTGGVVASFRNGTLSVTTDCSPTCVASNSGFLLTMKGSNGYLVVQPVGGGSSCCSMTFVAGVTDTSIRDIAIYRKDQESWLGTASIAATTLTLATTTSGAIQNGDFVYSNGVAPGTRVTAVLGGGLYTVSISQTLSVGRMSSAQTFNPDYIATIKRSPGKPALNPRILRVGLAYGSPNVQSQTRDGYISQLSSMLWAGTAFYPPSTWVGGPGAVGTISSGRAGALDCGAGAITGINFCAPLPADSGASVYVDGETATGSAANSASPFSVSVTGSISGTTLTTTAGTVDGLRAVVCTGCARGTIITGGSGTTWTVNISQTVSSQAMVLYPTFQIGNKPPIMIGGNLWGGDQFGGISANNLYLFAYDDIQKLWLSTPGSQSGGQSLYVPVEVQAELCNVTGTDCWFQPPYMYDDASLITFGQKACANVNGKIYIEFANEDFADNFGTTDSIWIGQRATFLGLPGTFRDYYGFMFARFMQKIRSGCGAASPATKVLGIETIFIASQGILPGVDPPREITERLGGFDLTLDANGYFTSAGGGSVQGYATAGKTFTVTAVNSGRIAQSMVVSGNGIAANVTITDFNNPTTGGGSGGNDSLALGTYLLSSDVGTVCSALSPCTWALGAVGTGNPIVTNWTRSPNRPVDYAESQSTATYFDGPNLVQGRSTDSRYVQFETPTYAITAISQANPGVVTATGIGSAAKAFANGDRVQLTTVGGMTTLNNAWATVSNLNAGANTFELSSITNQICCTPTGTAQNVGVQMTSANPAVVTWTGSNLAAGTKIRFIPTPLTTSSGPVGTLPSPVTADTDYFVIATGLTANTFQFSATLAGSAVSTLGAGTPTGIIGAFVVLSNDTSGLSAYTSGGVLKRIIPGVNAPLLSWADQYATGTAVSQQAALTSVMNDVISGTRLNASNVATAGQATVTAFQATWPSFVSVVTAYPWLNTRQYEGAYDGAVMSNNAVAELGISGLYANKIWNLYIAFRQSDQHRNVNNLMMQNFANFAGLNGKSPAQSTDFASSSVNLWGIFPGTLYTAPLESGQAWSQPFTNFDAISNFNAGLP